MKQFWQSQNHNHLLFMRLCIVAVIMQLIGCAETAETIVSLQESGEPRLTRGIFGTVTSLHPVTVNGFALPLVSFEMSTIDGMKAKHLDLRVGQVVAVVVSGSASDLHIVSFDIHHILLGPVIAAIGSDLVAVGQRIVPRDSAVFVSGQPGPGHWVAVSGLWRHDGVILATDIELLPSQGAGLIRGVAAAVTEKSITIGESRFIARAALPPLIPGETLVVRFTADEASLRTLGVMVVTDNFFDRNVDSAILEGYVAKGDDGRLRLAGLPYILIANSGLRVGDRVTIHGQFLPGLIFEINQVQTIN